MKKIATLSDIKKGKSLDFEYEGKKAILIRTGDDELVAYYTKCPHQDGTVEWDPSTSYILCECHMALFHVNDGSIYRHGRGMKIDRGLTSLNVTVDENKGIFVST